MGPDQALVTSIGEHVLSYVGKDAITKLVVTMSISTHDVEVVLSPRDVSTDGQLKVLGKLSEVEDVFAEEVAMTIRLESPDSTAFNLSNSQQLAFTA